MTAEQFVAIQEYLVPFFWPFIKVWMFGFLAAAIILAALYSSLVLTRRALARLT